MSESYPPQGSSSQPGQGGYPQSGYGQAGGSQPDYGQTQVGGQQLGGQSGGQPGGPSGFPAGGYAQQPAVGQQQYGGYPGQQQFGSGGATGRAGGGNPLNSVSGVAQILTVTGYVLAGLGLLAAILLLATDYGIGGSSAYKIAQACLALIAGFGFGAVCLGLGTLIKQRSGT